MDGCQLNESRMILHIYEDTDVWMKFNDSKLMLGFLLYISIYTEEALTTVLSGKVTLVSV